ncbi:MAG: hypothetical protein AABZ64_06210 [Nitrospinota bacterium]
MLTQPVLLIVLIVALAALYVLLPVAADAYGRFRSRRRVRCPETGEETSIQVDAEHAARTSLIGRPRLQIADCRHWPGRHGCGQKCLEQVG